MEAHEDGLASAQHLVNAGLSLEDVSSSNVEIEVLIGHLVGRSLTAKEVAVITDLRVIDYCYSSLTTLEDVRAKLYARACKLAHLLGVPAGEVQHVLLKDAQRAVKSSRLISLYDYHTRLYNFISYSGDLYWTALPSAAEGRCSLKLSLPTSSCSFVELPDSCLLLTGGYWRLTPTREVGKVLVRHDFAVVSKPSMLEGRAAHCSVYFRDYVYVIGFIRNSCERFNCTAEVWSPLPSLPSSPIRSQVCAVVALAQTQSVYAVTSSSLVYELPLERLEWTQLQLKLPVIDELTPYFQLNGAEFFMMARSSLYSLNPSSCEVKLVKQIQDAVCFGLSYYVDGLVYCASRGGRIEVFELGSLR
jgi:hypothetical protein